MEEIAEIKRAKQIKTFLVSWGMTEGEAKKTALRIAFNVNLECLDFSDPDDKSSLLA